MILWISGPTGSGKSSLARVLARLGYAVVQEQLPEQLFRDFSMEPVRHCEALQCAIIRSRFSQWQNFRSTRKLAFDRSIDEDVSVFCRMHRELELLDDNQLARLQTLSRELQTPMPGPDLIIYMQAERAQLRQRLVQGGHPQLIIDNLDRQVTLYSEWIASRRENVLKLDNSRCSLRSVQQMLLGAETC